MIRDRARDPVFWSDTTQLLKTVVAVVVSWALAVRFVGTPQSFLAPWAALLVVHATVFRTFSQGARQVAGAVAGVLLAWGAGNLIGPDLAALGVVVLLGLLLGRSRLFEGESTTAAATALVVLTTGFADDQHVLVSRLLDTAIGIGVGLVINFTVWPPLRRRTAITAMDALDTRIGTLLVAIAEGLESGCTAEEMGDFLERTREVDEELDHAWSLVRQARESALLNPRRSARTLRHPEEWVGLMRRMEQAVAECRSIARTLERSIDESRNWHPDFRPQYADVMHCGGRAVERADVAGIRECRERLDGIVERLGNGEAIPELWPVYGGLVVNLANILDALEEVAAANPMSQPPVPFRVRRPRR
jgi:uncharacterized membrane protein YccC